MADEGYSILWASIDAPIAGFSGLWPGYVSPAHRALIDQGAIHPPLTESDLRTGWIFSNICNSNFGTNFYVSQAGALLFRYVISTAAEDVSDARAARFGWQAVTPFEQIFTKSTQVGKLPPVQSYIVVESEDVVLLSCKKAEDGNGYILRFWNISDNCVTTTVNVALAAIESAEVVNLVEEGSNTSLPCTKAGFELTIGSRSLYTVRLVPSPADTFKPPGNRQPL
jgi:alpha-mannosidase